MKRVSRVVLVWGCLLGVACGDKKNEDKLRKDNEALRRKNNELQAQINQVLGADTPNLISVRERLEEIKRQLKETQERETALLEEKRYLEEEITDLTSSDSGAKIKELRDRIREIDAQLKAEQEKFQELNERHALFEGLVRNTLEPFWGLYVQRGPDMNLLGTTCRLFVYADPKGTILRAVACQDGKYQWEIQVMNRFDALYDPLLEGRFGFGILTEGEAGSCLNGPSFMTSSARYVFERTPQYGSSAFAVAVRTDHIDQPVFLDNASIGLKSNDCEDILARLENPASVVAGQQMILQLAGHVCRHVQGEIPVLSGCFRDPLTYELAPN